MKVIKPSKSVSRNQPFLRYPKYALQRDILNLGVGIFEIEKEIKSSDETDFIIPVSFATSTNSDIIHIESLMERLFYSVFSRPISIRIVIGENRINKRKKSVADIENDRSIKFFGVTLVERSDENLKWMREHGYNIKKRTYGNRGRRGRRRRT